MRLYWSVFLPTILYGTETGDGVWWPAIKNKVTHTRRLVSLQRKVIRSICGAYRNASSAKLLEITNTIELDSEIEIRAQTVYLDQETKGKTRQQMRRDRLNERERELNLGPNSNTMNITKRSTVWVLIEAAPFRSYLQCRSCTDTV